MTAIVEPTRPKPHSLGAGFALEAHLDRDNEKLLEVRTHNPIHCMYHILTQYGRIVQST